MTTPRTPNPTARAMRDTEPRLTANRDCALSISLSQPPEQVADAVIQMPARGLVGQPGDAVGQGGEVLAGPCHGDQSAGSVVDFRRDRVELSRDLVTVDAVGEAARG